MSAIPPPANPNLMRKTDFAAANGWGKSYVSKLAAEGRLVLNDDGLVLAAESLQRIRATTNAPERASPPAVTPILRADRDRKEFYDAENARLDLEERLGRLAVKSRAIAVFADAGTRLRAHLEALPPRLAPQLAALGGNEARIQAALAHEVTAALEEFSRGFARLSGLGQAEEV